MRSNFSLLIASVVLLHSVSSLPAIHTSNGVESHLSIADSSPSIMVKRAKRLTPGFTCPNGRFYSEKVAQFRVKKACDLYRKNNAKGRTNGKTRMFPYLGTNFATPGDPNTFSIPIAKQPLKAGMGMAQKFRMGSIVRRVATEYVIMSSSCILKGIEQRKTTGFRKSKQTTTWQVCGQSNSDGNAADGIPAAAPAEAAPAGAAPAGAAPA